MFLTYEETARLIQLDILEKPLDTFILYSVNEFIKERLGKEPEPVPLPIKEACLNLFLERKANCRRIQNGEEVKSSDTLKTIDELLQPYKVKTI